MWWNHSFVFGEATFLACLVVIAMFSDMPLLLVEDGRPCSSVLEFLSSLNVTRVNLNRGAARACGGFGVCACSTCCVSTLLKCLGHIPSSGVSLISKHKREKWFKVYSTYRATGHIFVFCLHFLFCFSTHHSFSVLSPWLWPTSPFFPFL